MSVGCLYLLLKYNLLWHSSFESYTLIHMWCLRSGNVYSKCQEQMGKCQSGCGYYHTFLITWTLLNSKYIWLIGSSVTFISVVGSVTYNKICYIIVTFDRHIVLHGTYTLFTIVCNSAYNISQGFLHQNNHFWLNMTISQTLTLKIQVIFTQI